MKNHRLVLVHNPFDNLKRGTLFVYEDRRDKSVTCQYVVMHDQQWYMYQFIPDPCTYHNGTLSDNPFHPDHPAWFAPELGKVADMDGYDEQTLIDLLCSDSPVVRSIPYYEIGLYHGFDNFDGHPQVLESVKVYRNQISRYNWRKNVVA